MVFKIGEVLSPAVAQALIRRGESSGGGAFIKRDPVVRRSSYDDSGRVQAQLALLREERLRKQAANDEARANRGEQFARDKREDEKDETDAERRERMKRQEKEDSFKEAQQLQKRRAEAAQIMQRIGSLIQSARKVNPDTGQPDPAKVQETQQVVRALLAQLMSMDLPESDKEAIRAQLRQFLPTTPPARAPNVQRGAGGQGGAQNPRMTGSLQVGGGAVDSGLAAELGIPTRTP